MKISLIDVDGHGFPNLALMKLSAWHKANGDVVDWYEPMFSHPDIIYASKVFTFTPDYLDINPNDPEPIRGGTGYNIKGRLPSFVEEALPDYSIYPQYDFALGFLSRGCIRNCPWCVVPRKEGLIHPVDEIERIAQDKKHVVLLDNNFLANEPDFVARQLNEIIKMKLYIDFNQALDCRLVNEENARLLAKVRWKNMNGGGRYIRFACDSSNVLPAAKKAAAELRKAGYRGGIFIYVLGKELEETYERVQELLSYDKKIDPFVMPYRNLDGDGAITNPELKHLARWCNRVSIRKRCSYHDYRHSIRATNETESFTKIQP